jgi:predicted NBD/HSP70 family sugar kinase
MKTTFLRKYQEYCRSKDSRNDIFKMQQQEDETLEDCVERFVYNLQNSRHNVLNTNTIRTVFLKGILEDYTDMLNLMAARDISQKPFE